MQYFQCKCGEHKSWTSMGVPRCTRCKKCGSDLAQGPDGHREPEPHRYVTKYNQNTGAPFEICDRCFERRDKLEPAKADDERA